MSKVLGFTNNGGEDWFVSSEYGNKEIQNIPDPEGGHSLNAPTAIPSPFARIDLVRKSFENIVESSSLAFLQRGSKVIVSKEDEKSVSQSLDLAEILFFYDNYKQNIEIVEWNKSTQIDILKKSNEIGHRRLGEVLELYLVQDKETFNFDLMKSIYLIKYNHQIIGGTSPLTLFFAAAKDISSLDLKSSSGQTYFKDIVPLYNRDESFQKYIYLLFKGAPILSEKMRAFQEYLNKSLQVLATTNAKLYSELNSLNVSDLNANYVELNTRYAGQVVEVLNVALRTVDPNEVINSIKKSDFVIHSSKYKGDKKPLVLQNKFNRSLKYIKADWDGKTHVPFVNAAPLSLRKLPGQDLVFPYLTVSDFLEPEIIRLVYPINSERFFNGNFKFEENPKEYKSYLLPLKPYFFEFFDVEDLVNGGIGKPHILIDESSVANSVRVRLTIPINDGRDSIVFDRIYHNQGAPDETANKGSIREHQFGLTIFPFIKHAEGIHPYYNIQVIDRDVVGEHSDAVYNLRFYTNDSNRLLLDPHTKDRNSKKKGDVSKVSTKYYHLEQGFDYIQLDTGFAKGLIIPTWNTSANNGNQFSFAVDFGTTNTHIEYSVGGTAPKVFEIGPEEIQAVPLMDDRIDHNFSSTGALDIRTSIVKEFLPQIVSSSTTHKFPHRTVIAQSKSHGPSHGGKTLVDFNIPFVYENAQDPNSAYFTNLKWDNKDSNNEYKVKAFLEQVVLLMRNKVLINGGDLSETKVVWTYPTSMSPARKNNLQRYWNDLYLKYFSSSYVPVDLPESIAPYYYFRGNTKLEGLGYGVSVLMDIGGGTSDVVVYENNIPKLISSYKFAGSALFGDGYKEYANIGNNGLINKFKEDYEKLLKEDAPVFHEIFQEIYRNQSSADLNSFLFSLHTNKQIKNWEVLNYSQKLAADSELKIIFLYFYCSKIYHIAKLMKANQIDLPINLIFSGNGSKILDLITPNHGLLSDISKAIFLSVYKRDSYIQQGLKINIEKRFPKEVTSKGALIHQKQGIAQVEIEGLRRVFTGLEEEGKFSLTSEELNKEVIRKVVNQVEDFNKLFISLNSRFDFNRLFDVSHQSFRKFKEVVNNHLEAFMLEGIEFNNRLDGAGAQPDAPVNETLFFYPLIETLQQLIKELGELEETA